MEKLFGTETNKQTIKDNLLAMAYATEQMVYSKPLEDTDLAKLEKEFIQSSVKYQKLKDDLDKVKEQFKQKMKPVEQLHKEQLSVLKTGTVQKEGMVYLIADQDERVMRIYDEEGVLLNMRPLLPGERQLSINSKAVND